MPFRLPTCNLTANVWRAQTRVPGIGPPDVTTLGNLCPGRRAPFASSLSGLDSWLLVPSRTDIRSTVCSVVPDLVEVPAGSGRYYTVAFVDDVHRGTQWEFRFALLRQLSPFPSGVGLVAGSNGLSFSRGPITSWSIEIFPSGGGVLSAALFDPSVPQVSSTTPLNLVRWYYVAIVWDNVTVSMYIDGVLEGSVAAVVPLRAPTGDDWWASTNGPPPTPGDWSELRFYQRALSGPEVIDDGLGNVQSGIVAQYHCDDGSGSTVTDSIGGVNATLVGSPSWLTSGPGGGAIRFDASATQLANVPTTLDNTSPFTFTLWYRPLPI